MKSQTAKKAQDQMDPAYKRFYGKYRGTVLDNYDPLFLGRIIAEVPAISGSLTNFAMPCVPYAGPGVGFYAIPPIGADVWIEFEGGDPNFPIWSGCFWAVTGEAPLCAPVPETKIFKTEFITMILSDIPEAGGFTLECIPPATNESLTMTFNPEGITITCPESVINMTPGSITLTVPESVVNMTAETITATVPESNVTMTAETISAEVPPTAAAMTAEAVTVESTDINATADGAVTVEAPEVNVTANVSIEGAVEITGETNITGALTVEGETNITPELTVEGDANVAGALTVEGDEAVAGVIEGVVVPPLL
jgi:hypothetical protein